MNLKTDFSSFCWNVIEILNGTALNPYVILKSVAILAILGLLVHKCGLSFYLFSYSLISFIRVSSLVKFISKHFIFWYIISGIVFLNFFLSYLLIVCRNITDYCMLMLHPATLLNLLISFKSSFVDSLRFSIYKSISSVNRGTFNFSFPIWISFIYFSCLVAIAKTSRSVLNGSCKYEHPCLVPDSWRKII